MLNSVNYGRILALVYSKSSAFIVVYFLTKISVNNEAFSPMYLSAIAASGLISFWISPLVVQYYAAYHNSVKYVFYILLVFMVVLALKLNLREALITMLIARNITDNMVLQNGVIAKKSKVIMFADIIRLTIVVLGLSELNILGDVFLISAVVLVEGIAVFFGYYGSPMKVTERIVFDIRSAMNNYLLVLPKLFEPVMLLYLVRHFSEHSSSIIILNQVIALVLFFVLNSFLYFYEEFEGNTGHVIRIYTKLKNKLIGLSVLISGLFIILVLFDQIFFAAMSLLLFYKVLVPMPDYLLSEFEGRKAVRIVLILVFLLLVLLDIPIAPVYIFLPFLLFNYQIIYELYHYPQS